MVVSGVLLVPLYLKFIPITLYGAWLATGNLLAWITLIDPGLALVLQREIANLHGSKDYKRIGIYITSGLILTSGISFLLLLFGLALYFVFPIFFSLPADVEMGVLRKSFLISLIGSSLLIFSYTVTAINQGLQSSKGVGLIYVIVISTGIVISMTLLKLNYGLFALAVVPMISGIGLTVGNLIYLFWRYRQDRIPLLISFHDLKTITKLLSFSFLGRLGNVISSNLDLFIVAKYLGPQYSAVLNLTRKAPEMCKTLIERPVIALIPTLSHLRGSGDERKQVEIVVRLTSILFWIIGFVMAGFITFNDDFVRFWVGETFYAGDVVSLILVITIFLSAITDSFGNLGIALGSIRKNSIAAFLQALVSAIFVFFGVKYFGLIGVVASPLISIVFVTGWLYPRYLIAVLSIDRSTLKYLVFEMSKVIAMIVVLSLSFSHLIANGISEFLFYILIFSCVYFIGLASLSRAFRSEIAILLSAIKA